MTPGRPVAPPITIVTIVTITIVTIEHPKPVSRKRKQPIAVEKSRAKRKKETDQVYTFTVYGLHYIYLQN